MSYFYKALDEPSSKLLFSILSLSTFKTKIKGTYYIKGKYILKCCNNGFLSTTDILHVDCDLICDKGRARKWYFDFHTKSV
jgi:hypothetical protein